MTKAYQSLCLSPSALALGIVLSLITTISFAKTETMPNGCYDEGYAFKHKMLTLYPKKEGNRDSVYFIYNQSNHTINLFHAKKTQTHHGVNINNDIKAHRWAVYSSDEEKVRFICTSPSRKYEHGEINDCGEVLKVCEFSNVKFGLNNRGNYWMVDSTSKNTALRKVNREHGVLLRR
jgi:hypothetical protein